MELKAKKVSLLAKIAAAVFVAVVNVLSWIFGWGVGIWDTIYVGLFIAFCFGTVDISLIAQNIFQKKLG